MKKKSSPVFPIYLAGAAALLLGCDPFQEDVIPKEKLVMVNTSATEYYVVPNSSVVIDMKAIVISSFENITIRISENPGRGTLTALNDFLFKYTPSAAFSEDVATHGAGSDQIKIAFTSNERILSTETITVHMTRYVGEFPCSLIAIEDDATTTAGVPVSIKILFNDRLCGINLKDVLISVSVDPAHGQVIASGDSLIYTSEIDFAGYDEVIYKITAAHQQRSSGNDGLMVSYGFVKINVSE